MKEKFFIIDGNSFLHRAFHALPPLTNAKGFPTNAITGALNMIMGLKKKHKPEKLVVVFDAKGNNFRHDIYSEYKANRSSMAEDLRVQIDPLHSIIKAWGIPIIIIEGVEADDSIASLAKIGVSQGYTSVMVTSDKDLKQFVTEDILMLDTKDTEKGSIPYGKEGVFEKEGVYPENIRLKLSLMGDSVDNVPGVPSVGPKTAIKWIEEYKNLEGIIENSINIKGSVGQKLRDNIDLLKLSYELVGIKDDLNIDIDIKKLKIITDDDSLYNYIEEFELNKLKKDLGLESKNF